MRNMPVLWLAMVFVTTSVSIFTGVRPSAAAEPTTTMNCRQAESMLGSAVSRKASAMLTGDVDKDYETLMVQRLKGAERIDQIEAKCGKDAKMQAMGVKASDTARQLIDELRKDGTSQ